MTSAVEEAIQGDEYLSAATPTVVDGVNSTVFFSGTNDGKAGFVGISFVWIYCFFSR